MIDQTFPGKRSLIKKKHLDGRQNRRNSSLDDNEQLEVRRPHGRPSSMKSSSRIIYTRPDKTVQWTPAQAADEVRLTNTALDTVN